MKWGIFAGPITRTRTMQRRYLEYLKTIDGSCPFCDIKTKQPEAIVSDNDSTQVIRNTFGYAIWEGCKVLDHLMIIPKQHRHMLEDFTKKEQTEWLRICAEYEAKGYSLYTRCPDSITKSIGHHHTHFIKLDKKRKSFMLYLRKPHFLITR